MEPFRSSDRAPARILLLSQRLLSDQVANVCLYEFEDLICALDEVDLVSATASAIQPGRLYKLARRCGAPRRLARTLALRQSEPAPARDYDLLIAILDSYRQIASVHRINEWRRRCRKAICFLPEIWPKDLQEGNAILELFDAFDHVFVGVDHCVGALGEIIGKPCSNLYPAVDAVRFHPHPSMPRTIEVCYIGRRSPVTHQALIAHTAANHLLYYYDTAKGVLRVADHGAHRHLLANLVKRSRYFIANYAKIDRPDQTWGMQEVGYRFFEGAAGGAVMLGQPPANAAFARLFPWPDAVIEAPFDAPDIADLMGALDADPERIARIRIANVVNCLRRHDWLYRYDQMLGVVDLEPTPRMAARRADLLELAAAFEQGQTIGAAAPPRRDRA